MLRGFGVLGIAVYASHPYDEADYLRNFEEFLAEANQTSVRTVK